MPLAEMAGMVASALLATALPLALHILALHTGKRIRMGQIPPKPPPRKRMGAQGPAKDVPSRDMPEAIARRRGAKPADCTCEFPHSRTNNITRHASNCPAGKRLTDAAKRDGGEYVGFVQRVKEAIGLGGRTDATTPDQFGPQSLGSDGTPFITVEEAEALEATRRESQSAEAVPDNSPRAKLPIVDRRVGWNGRTAVQRAQPTQDDGFAPLYDVIDEMAEHGRKRAEDDPFAPDRDLIDSRTED